MPPDDRFRFKAIRDPLYGFIRLSEREIKTIDTEVFRRLQTIKQLSHSYVAYPSSIHTRFEHSLGTCFVSGMMADELGIRDPDDVETIRLSSLLHDVGHGPFSHLFEEIVRTANPGVEDPHEKISKIIIGEDPHLDAVLGPKKNDVMDLLEKDRIRKNDAQKLLQSDIVSSYIDADKMDYLRRDSYHIGVAYGQFDLSRILHTLTTNLSGSNICIGIKGMDAFENFRLARYLMHAQVYTHHARLAAEQMFLNAVKIALYDENVLDADLLRLVTRGGHDEFLGFYTALDDCSIYEMIRNHPAARVSKMLLDNIRKRRLLKRVCEFTPRDLADSADVEGNLLKMSQPGLDKYALEISQSLNLEPHDVVFMKSEIKNKLFHRNGIYCRNGNKIRNLNEISPISGRDTIKFLIFGPADTAIRDKMVSLASDMLETDLGEICRP